MKARWNDRAREDAFYFIETHFWNGDVDAFFALGEERTALLVDTMLERAGRRPEGLVVLDVGCGVGRFTRALAGRFREAIGVDVSDEMIARAAEFNPPTGIRTSRSGSATARRYRSIPPASTSSSATRCSSTSRRWM